MATKVTKTFPARLHPLALNCAIRDQPGNENVRQQEVQNTLSKAPSDGSISSQVRGKLSSPRAESARAFTGTSHSGRGEDFLSRQPIFFTETAVTPEWKVEKSFPRWEINRHAKG